MSTAVSAGLILVLVLLFLKVPVFVSIIAGSVAYFFRTPMSTP